MSMLFTQPIYEFFLSARISFLQLLHSGQRNVTTVLDDRVTQAILLKWKTGTIQDFYGECLNASFED